MERGTAVVINGQTKEFEMFWTAIVVSVLLVLGFVAMTWFGRRYFFVHVPAVPPQPGPSPVPAVPERPRHIRQFVLLLLGLVLIIVAIGFLSVWLSSVPAPPTAPAPPIPSAPAPTVEPEPFSAPTAPEVTVPELVTALGDSDGRVAQEAANRLICTRDAVGPLVDIYVSGNPQMKARARWCLVRMGEWVREFYMDVLTHPNRHSPATVVAVRELVGTIKAEEEERRTRGQVESRRDAQIEAIRRDIVAVRQTVATRDDLISAVRGGPQIPGEAFAALLSTSENNAAILKLLRSMKESQLTAAELRDVLRAEFQPAEIRILQEVANALPRVSPQQPSAPPTPSAYYRCRPSRSSRF